MARYVGASTAGLQTYLSHRRVRRGPRGIWVMRDPFTAPRRLGGGIVVTPLSSPKPSPGRPSRVLQQVTGVLAGQPVRIQVSDPATIRRGRL